MLRKNPILTLSAILVVLLLLAWLTGAFRRNPSTLRLPQLAVKTEDVVRLRIEHPGRDPVVLERSAAGWQLTAPLRYPADSLLAARFVEDLSKTTLESVVSTNPERYAHFGVTDTSAVRLVVYRQQGDSLRFFWGHTGPDFDSRYVRLATDARIFLARTNLSFPEELDRWRDKTVVRIPAAQIEALEVAQQGQRYGVRRTDAGWALLRDGASLAADSAAAARWASQFGPLRADGFMTVSADSVRQAAQAVLTLRLSGSTSQVLYFLERPDGWAVVRNRDSVVFRLYAYRRSQLLPEVTSLQAK